MHIHSSSRRTDQNCHVANVLKTVTNSSHPPDFAETCKTVISQGMTTSSILSKDILHHQARQNKQFLYSDHSLAEFVWPLS